MNTKSGANKPLTEDSEHTNHREIDFTYDDRTSVQVVHGEERVFTFWSHHQPQIVYKSCGLTWKNEIYIFGGENKKYSWFDNIRGTARRMDPSLQDFRT